MKPFLRATGVLALGAISAIGATADPPTVSRVPSLDPTVAAWEFPLSVQGELRLVRLRPLAPGPTTGTRPEPAEVIAVIGEAVVIGPMTEWPIVGVLEGRRTSLLLDLPDQTIWLTSDGVVASQPWESVLAAPHAGPIPHRIRVRFDASACDWPESWSALAVAAADAALRRIGVVALQTVGDPELHPELPRPHLSIRLLSLEGPAATAPPRIAAHGALCDPHGRAADIWVPSAPHSSPAETLDMILAVAAGIVDLVSPDATADVAAPRKSIGTDAIPIERSSLRLPIAAAAELATALAELSCVGPPELTMPVDVVIRRIDCTSVALSWRSVDGAERYEVLEGVDERTEAMRPVTTVDTTAWSAQDNGGDARRWFAVRPIAGGRSGPPSEAVFVDPIPWLSAPAASATVDLCHGIDLSWTPVVGAVEYEIFRAASERGALQPIGRTGELHWWDEAVRPGSERWYTVAAIDACGRGGPRSGTVRGVAASAPAAVSDVDAKADCTGVRVRWNGVPAATQYILLRAVDDAAPDPIALVEKTDWFDPDPPAEVRLRYAVQAAGPCGLAVPSPTVETRFQGRSPLLEPLVPIEVRCGESFAVTRPRIRNAQCAGRVEWIVPDGDGSGAASIDESGTLWLSLDAPGAQEIPLRAVGAGGEATVLLRATVLPSAPHVMDVDALDVKCGVPWQADWPEVTNRRCAGAVVWRIVAAPDGIAAIDSPDEVTNARFVGLRWSAPTPGSHVIRLACAGERETVDVTMIVNVGLESPRIDPILENVLPAGAPLLLPLPKALNDLCAGPLQWTVTESPEGVLVDRDDSGAILRWPQPTAGRHEVRCIATGAAGEADLLILVRVAPPAPQPIALELERPECAIAWTSQTPRIANLDDAGPVQWRLVEAPEGASATDDGTVHWPRPTPGEHSIALDCVGPGGSATLRYRVKVRHQLPVILIEETITIPAATATLDASMSLANAECGGTVQWRLLSGPIGAVIVSETGQDALPETTAHARIVWAAPVAGRHPVSVAVGNAEGEIHATTILVVDAVPPRIDEPAPLLATCGQPVDAPLPTVRNVRRAGAVRWHVSAAPPGVTIADGSVRWTRATAGTHVISLRAEGDGGEAIVSLPVHVAAVPPRLLPMDPQVIGCGLPFPPTTLQLAQPLCTGSTRWEIIEGPSGLSVDIDGAVFWPEPIPGHYPTVVQVQTELGTDRVAWTISVEATAAPEVAAVPREATHRVRADDAVLPYRGPALRLTRPGCMEPVAWRLVTAPVGMAIQRDGAVVWPVPVAGLHEVMIEAQNGRGTLQVSWMLRVEADEADEDDASSYTFGDAAQPESVPRRDARPFRRGDGDGPPLRGLSALPQVAKPQVHPRACRRPRRDHRARRRLRGRGTPAEHAPAWPSGIEGDDLSNDQAPAGGGHHHPGALRSQTGPLPTGVWQGATRLHRLHAHRSSCGVPQRRTDAIA